MRLHHLEITGFGPFADTVRIDFDALSDAGLFLLSGPTGAGKSSVLDAVCFALYGDVPGDRSTAKRLRSDQAGDDVVPRVVLEATMAGRRFRIDRSPAWQRPKKRGSGLTTEQARVVISERRAGDDDATPWHPLSTRLDETGHLVTRLARAQPAAVLPGRHAPAGPLPGLPAGPLRGAARPAPTGVPDRPVRPGRALAARSPGGAASRLRGPAGTGSPTW